jgi:hypothetical protein
MKKVKISFFLYSFCIFIFYGCAGIPGTVAKYGEPGCTEWAQRNAYRQVCDRWSDGVCMNYKTESYYQDYCVHWKTKEELEYEKSVLNHTLLNQSEEISSEASVNKTKTSNFPKISGAPTAGEAYLINEIAPFICSIVNGDAINKLIEKGIIKDTDLEIENAIKFDLNNFSVILIYHYNKIIQVLFDDKERENNWLFTQNEFIAWLSNSGFKIPSSNYGKISGGFWVNSYDDYFVSKGILISVAKDASNPGKLKGPFNLSFDRSSGSYLGLCKQ